MEIKLAMGTVPEPPKGTRKVLVLGNGTAVIRGRDKEAPLTFVCGECSASLATRMYRGELGTLVLKCNHCGAFNEAI